VVVGENLGAGTGNHFAGLIALHLSCAHANAQVGPTLPGRIEVDRVAHPSTVRLKSGAITHHLQGTSGVRREFRPTTREIATSRLTPPAPLSRSDKTSLSRKAAPG
jgi:hypothetical protein